MKKSMTKTNALSSIAVSICSSVAVDLPSGCLGGRIPPVVVYEEHIK